MISRIFDTADRFLREQTLPSVRRLSESRQPLVWLLALAIGVAGAYAILAFRWGIGAVQYLWLGSSREQVTATLAHQLHPMTILIALIVGGLVVGFLLSRLAPNGRPEALAEVIEAANMHQGRLGWRSGLSSALISAISLGAGASGGREGPAVHLGASVASFLGERFALSPAMRRVVLAAGGSAAVSASFNAPIAGVLFAHEVILAHYALSGFVPTVLSAVAATLITRHHLGDFPAFIIPDYHITSYWEFPAFALLGVVCGLVAVIFEAALIGADWTARRIEMPLWSRPVVGGLAVGLIAIAVPEVIGVGYEATNAALRQHYPLYFLIILIVAKTAATAITLASRFGGGVFSPSIYLGAMTGGAFGIIAGSVFPQYASDHGVYALLGMGAVAGAVLGAPISTTVIVFELTGGYELTIGLLLAVSIASMVDQALVGFSYFHWQLSLRGLTLGDGPHRRIMRNRRVVDFMTAMSDEDRAEAAALADDALRLNPHDSLETALREFGQGDIARIAVVDPQCRTRPIAWVEYAALLKFYNQALIDAGIEEHR